VPARVGGDEPVPRGGSNGFTLVEVLIAVVLAGIVALLLHGGTKEIAAIGERAASHRRDAASAAAIRRQVAAWLRTAYLEAGHEGKGFEGINGLGAGTDGDRLRFRSSAGSWGRTGSLFLELRMERGTGFVAVVTDVTATGASSQIQRIALVPEARQIQIRYYLDTGGERRWVDEWRGLTTLPRAVELRILGDSVPPLLRAPLIVGLPVGAS
jgi:prepilin-type N-terminal cleavage/methylation domain-containing protein